MAELKKLQIGDFVDFVQPSDIGARTRQIELREGMQWFCVLVRAGCHRRVEVELAQHGLRSFYPRLKRWVSHARTRTAKEFPILGRYVFVEATEESFWKVVSVYGVDGFVIDAEGPVEIGSDIVMQFRERYFNGEWDFVRRDCKRPVYDIDSKGKPAIIAWETNEPIPVGARVRILVGEFEDMLATVTNRKGKKVDFKLKDANVYSQLSESGVRAA